MLVDINITISQSTSNPCQAVLIQLSIFLRILIRPVSRWGDMRHLCQNITPMAVVFKRGFVAAEVQRPGETSIQRSPIQYNSILNIIATVTHNSYLCVHTSRQVLKIAQLNSLCFDHGFLRVEKQHQQSVHSAQLVAANRTDCLFSHSALVSVTGRLVVVGVGDEAGDDAEDGERVYF